MQYYVRQLMKFKKKKSKKVSPNNGFLMNSDAKQQNEVQKSNKYSIIYLTGSFFGLKTSLEWKGTKNTRGSQY